MTVARPLGWVAAVVALSCVLLGFVAGAGAATPKNFFGVASQAPLSSADFERMATAKVGTLRLEIFWSGADPTAAPDDYEWARTDEVVRGAAASGIQVLPFVFSTPGWVAALDGRQCADTCAAYAPRGPAALAAWRDFLGAATARYGPGGDFWAQNPLLAELPIRTWQLWNEQNSPTFYKPKPDVRGYAKLLTAGHEAITAVDAQAEIVLGGMFGKPLGGRKPGIAAWTFLDELYDRRGIKRRFDGVASHPYAAQFSEALVQVERLREEMVEADDGDAEIWITELGWASAGVANPLNRGPRGQADRLAQAFKYFLKKRTQLNIRSVTWYSWRDNPDLGAGLCTWCPYSGLVAADLTDKRSLKAFTRFTDGS